MHKAKFLLACCMHHCSEFDMQHDHFLKKKKCFDHGVEGLRKVKIFACMLYVLFPLIIYAT